MIEPVRSGSDSGAARLAFWDGTDTRIGREFEYNGRTYQAARMDPNLTRVMPMPAKASPFSGSAGKLLREISATVQRYSGFDDELGVLVSFFVLATWQIGLCPTAPRLSVLGPETIGGTQLMQLLHCFCRRPLSLTEVDPGGIRSLPMAWRPTLLIRQPRLTLGTERLLGAAHSRDVQVPHSSGLLDVHCCVATYTELLTSRQPGNFAGIEIPVSPVSSNVVILDEATQRELTERFQARLLGYRFANYAKAGRSTLAVSEIGSPIAEIARCFVACTPDEPGLQSDVVRLLKQRVVDHRSERWTAVDCVMLEALLERCHAGGGDVVYVGEIAFDAEVIMEGRGEAREVAPREVGGKLRLLGLETKRDEKGYRLRLTKAIRQKVHRLARDFGVPPVSTNENRCPDCDDISHLRGNE